MRTASLFATILPARDLRLARLITVVASLLLSILAVLLSDLPENDAYTYVRTAEIALDSGVNAAFDHYAWAHLPLLMAGLHALTGMDLFTAAWVVNALLYALLSLAFVNLVAAMTASRRVVYLAALCILVYPHLNEFRAFIIRDIGFLAFCLVAALQLLRYEQLLRIRYAVGFIAACLVAGLFRSEAFALMLLTPACLLFNPQYELGTRCRTWLRLESIALLLLATLFAASAFSEVALLDQLQDFLKIYQPFANNVPALFGRFNPGLADAVFGSYAAQYASDYLPILLLVGLVAVLLACIVDSLGLVVAPMLGWGVLRRYSRLPEEGNRVMASWLLSSFLILLLFILLTRFMTTRYTLLLCTLLLVYLPFIIDRAWSMATARRQMRRFTVLMSVLLLYCVLDAHISFGAPKQHLRDGTAWINSHADEYTGLLTNETYLAYHSGQVADYDQTQRDLSAVSIRTAEPGTLIAVTPRRSFESVLTSESARGSLRLLQRFEAQRGQDLLIFEKR